MATVGQVRVRPPKNPPFSHPPSTAQLDRAEAPKNGRAKCPELAEMSLGTSRKSAFHRRKSGLALRWDVAKKGYKTNPNNVVRLPYCHQLLLLIITIIIIY